MAGAGLTVFGADGGRVDHASVRRTRGRRGNSANSLRRSNGLDAGRAHAAVPIDRAGPTHRDAGRRYPAIDPRLAVAAQDARSIGHARRQVAAVHGRRTSSTRLDAARSEAIAAWNPEEIDLTDAGIAHPVAAIVARRGNVAGVVLEVTDITLWVAAAGIAADPEGLARVDLTDDVAIARQARARSAATVAVRATQIPVDPAAARRLAHTNASRRVGGAQAAAAAVTGAAHGAVDAVRAVGCPRGRRSADAERPCRDLAITRTAGAAVAADIARLDAERCTQLADPTLAQAGAALGTIRAGIPGGAASGAERLARTGSAIAAAAGRRIHAGQIVGHTCVGAAATVGADERAALGRRLAAAAGGGAGIDGRRTGAAGRVADRRAAVIPRDARLAKGQAEGRRRGDVRSLPPHVPVPAVAGVAVRALAAAARRERQHSHQEHAGQSA